MFCVLMHPQIITKQTAPTNQSNQKEKHCSTIKKKEEEECVCVLRRERTALLI